MDKITVATVRGSETTTVTRILGEMGVTVVIVSNLAQRVKFDRLLLLGGADIAPGWYGETNQHCGRLDKQRDSLEWALMRYSMGHGIPIMGICRGAQFLAVAHGSRLVQDIYRQGLTGDHPRMHRINVKKPLEKYIPTDLVNSYHHQAIAQAPGGFDVLAKSPDGIIEATWKPGILGVQFHPEMLYPQDNRWRRLFQWFVDGLT